MDKIKCCFDISYEYINKKIRCSFDLVNDNNIKITYSNNVTSNYEFNNNVQLCSGYIKEDNNSIPNATIYFMTSSQRQNTEEIYDGINGIKNAKRNHTFEMKSNNIIVDKCVSNSEGKYIAFVENGIYDIKIEINGYIDILKNQEITDGITQEHYYTIDSTINKKIGKSTYIMNKYPARMINVSLLNEYGNFINGDLIITQNNNLIVYKKINNKNNMFALENGIYDIRIRNKNTNVKIIKNFEFNEDDDFIEKLITNFNMNDSNLLEVY